MMPTDGTNDTEVISLKPTPSFASLGVNRWLVGSLAAMAIRRPTPIQAACIGPILEGVLYYVSGQCHPSLWSQHPGGGGVDGCIIGQDSLLVG